MGLFNDTSSVNAGQSSWDNAMFQRALLGPQQPDGKYDNPSQNKMINAQGSNGFRYGDFSPEAQQQQTKLGGYIDQLRGQQAPGLATTKYNYAGIDPTMTDRSQSSMSNANAAGMQSDIAIRNALNNDQTGNTQNSLVSRLQSDLNGNAPSLAQQQLQAGQAANNRQALSMAAGARGGAGNQAAALRDAMNAGATGNQALNAQQGMQRAQEYQSAESALGNVAGQQRSQDLQNRYSAIDQLNNLRSGDLSTSNMAYGQGLSSAQFDAQQSQYESNLRANEATTRANLDAQQRQMQLQGTLGYGAQANSVAGMDMSGRQAYNEMMSNRDLSSRGLAITSQANDADQTYKDINLVQGILSDVRAKKNIEPADANAVLRKAFDSTTRPVDTSGMGLPANAAPVVEDARGQRYWQTRQGLVPVHADEAVPTNRPTSTMPESAVDRLNRLYSETLTGSRNYTGADEQAQGARVRQLGATGESGSFLTSPAQVNLRPAQGYSYEYKDPNAPGAVPGRQVGPMAQDLEKTPAGAAAVVTNSDGKKSVDTSRLSLVNTAAIAQKQKEDDARDSAIQQLFSMVQGKQYAPAYQVGQ